MAELNARIIAKASATAGETPQAVDLEVAEIAVNTADGKLFTKHTDETVKEISGEGGGASTLGELTDVEEPTLGDSYIDSVTLLVKGDGSIVDQSQSAHSLTIANVGINSTDPKYGLGCLEFSGNGALVTPTSSDFDLSAVGGTIEFWFRVASYPTSIPFVLVSPNDSNLWALWVDDDNNLTFWRGADRMSLPVSLNDWHHAALTYDHTAEEYKLFMDGTLAAGSHSYPWEDDGLRFGSRSSNAAYLTGLLDEIRVTKGVLRYTGPYTPPTRGFDRTASSPLDGQVLTWVQSRNQWEPADPSGGGGAVGSLDDLSDVNADSPSDGDILVYNSGPLSAPVGDLVITCIDGTIQDLSTNNFTVSPVNTGPDVIAGGVSNNCLDFSVNNGGLTLDTTEQGDTFDLQGDYTIEFHIKYVNGGSGNYATVFNKDQSSSVKAWGVTIQSDTGNLLFNGHSAPFGSRLEDVWYHAAIVKSGDDAVFYKDGVAVATWENIAAPPVKSSVPLQIGAGRLGSLNSGQFLLDNIRIASTPLYSGDFTPPADISYTVGEGTWESTTVSGGGAVDSVNDQTGVVSLGIQDMDDFELNDETNPYFDYGTVRIFVSGTVNASWYNQPGRMLAWENGRTLRFNDDADNKTGFMAAASAAGWVLNQVATFWIKRSDGAWTEHQGDYTDGGSYVSLASISPEIAQFDGLSNGSLGETVSLSFSDPASAPKAPLTESDILQWDNAGQKFRPAQAKKRIQDMDDFELSQTEPSVNILHSGTWDLRLLEPNYPTVQGEWMTLSGTGDIGNGVEALSILFLDDLDKDGNSFVTAWNDIGATPASYSLRYTDTEGTKGPFQVLGLSRQGNTRAAIYWDANEYPGDSPAGDLYVEFVEVVSAGDDVPLIDGDVLQWNDADQKFKPAQISGGGGGAVDSVNDQTGVVSLGIQDMDDYALTPGAGLPGSRWADVATSGGSYQQPGNAMIFDLYGGGRLFCNNTDSDGLDFGALVAAAIAANGGSNSDITFYATRNGGLNWTTHVASTVAENSPVSGVTYFDSVSPTLDVTTDELRLSFQDPAQYVLPLADGDVLQWNGPSQKFRPTSDHISLTTLKAEVAASTDFTDFQARIAAL